MLKQACDLYSGVLRDGYGRHFLPRYLFAAGVLTQSGNAKGVRLHVHEHLKLGMQLADNSPPDRDVERFAEFAATKRSVSSPGFRVSAGIATGLVFWAIAIPIVMANLFGTWGCLVSPLVQVLLLCLSSDWRNLKSNAKAPLGFLASLPGLLTAYEMGANNDCLIALLAAQLAATSTLILFEHLQHRFTLFFRLTCHLARLGRRVDCAADEWALWIKKNVPKVLHPIFLRSQQVPSRPELRSCWRWLIGGVVCANEISLFLLTLVEAIDQFFALPVRPQRARPQRSLRILGATWAVRLRLPLHSPRGDGVPLYA
jgi:hypothetical protein